MFRAIISKIFFISFLCNFTVFADHTRRSVEEIQKKPPTERIQIYSSVLQSNQIPLETKNDLIKAFAQDARNLSPQYGKSSVKINQKQWINFLFQGIEALPEDQNIVFALTQLLINNKQYKCALQVIEPYHKKHPSHETTAWLDYCLVHTIAESPEEESPIFDVHFCILTENPEARKKCTLEQLKHEVLILNRTFQTFKKKSLIKFRFKSASFFEDIQADQSPLEQMTNNGQPFDSNRFNEHYNQCRNLKIRDTKAINFYVYDSHNSQSGYKDITSHGRRNSNRPYILLDWQRLNNNVQNPSAHEMGHAFGLGHVAVPGATLGMPTNIMCSTQYGFGSGGNRRLGFTEAQSAVILYHAKRTKQRLLNSDP